MAPDWVKSWTVGPVIKSPNPSSASVLSPTEEQRIQKLDFLSLNLPTFLMGYLIYNNPLLIMFFFAIFVLY